MSPGGLIDTGAILALLDRNDKWHHSCVSAFRNLTLPLVTTSAILTELFHLLGPNPSEFESAWAFLRSGAVRVVPISGENLAGVESLMRKYRDRPMDFADATLVQLAREEGLRDILTVDHNDFETYRIRGREPLLHPPASTFALTAGPSSPWS